MKFNFTVGGKKGTAISRLYNPLLFGVATCACLFGAAICVAVGLMFLVCTPFAWLFTVRVTQE